MTTSSSGSDDAVQKKALSGRVFRGLVDAAAGARRFVREGRHFPESRSTTKLSDTWSGLKEEVHYLVYFSDEFIVYIDHDLDIEWKTTEALDKSFDEKGDDIKSKHYNVLMQAAAAETMPTDGLDYQQVLRFKRLIGEAIACSLVLEFDNALSTIGFARDYLRDRTQEVS